MKNLTNIQILHANFIDLTIGRLIRDLGYTLTTLNTCPILTAALANLDSQNPTKDQTLLFTTIDNGNWQIGAYALPSDKAFLKVMKANGINF